jgi:alkane 1-monooxygenase
MKARRATRAALGLGDPGLKTYTYVDDFGTTATYADRKRSRWVLSLLLPLLPLVAIALAEATGWRMLLWSPLAFIYLAVPLLDWLIGVDADNPPEPVVRELERDPWYRWLTYAALPVHAVVLVLGIWYAVEWTEAPVERLAVVLSLGFMAALAINTGHELGHKRERLDQWLSRVALALSGYGHFRIEHNLGHHVQVATPEDSASARMGESLYRFLLRELPGGMRRAWRLEAARLQRAGRPAWSVHNEILQAHAITLLLQGGLVAWLGWQALPWLVLHNLFAWFQVTGVNYIEHYGLLRQRHPDGTYERCRPRHSWNSNHAVSNLMLFHLQRHSDHHAHAERRYQSLRHFDEAPQLPAGYMGMLLLAEVPPLYYWIMDRLLIEQAGGDLRRINVDPARRSALERRYAGAMPSPK